MDLLRPWPRQAGGSSRILMVHCTAPLGRPLISAPGFSSFAILHQEFLNHIQTRCASLPVCPPSTTTPPRSSGNLVNRCFCAARPQCPHTIPLSSPFGRLAQRSSRYFVGLAASKKCYRGISLESETLAACWANMGQEVDQAPWT